MGNTKCFSSALAVLGVLSAAQVSIAHANDELVVAIDASYKKLERKGEDVTTNLHEALGSGFLISADGHVGTAFHVVEGWSNLPFEQQEKFPIVLTFGDRRVAGDSRKYFADIVAVDPDDDFAILKIREDFATDRNAKLCTMNPSAETELVASGFPGTPSAGFANAPVSFGSDRGPRGQWVVTSPFSPGMSGGAVFIKGTPKVVGFVTSGSLTDQNAKFVVPTENFFAKVAGELPSNSGPNAPNCADISIDDASTQIGAYKLEATVAVQSTERRTTLHQLGQFKGKNKEIDRAVRPSAGWEIDVNAPRQNFVLSDYGADNGRCVAVRWNTLSASGLTVYARVDQTKHAFPKDAHVNCQINLPEIRVVVGSENRVLENPKIDWESDTLVSLPPNTTAWRLTVTNPRGKPEIFVGPREGRSVTVSTSGSDIVISPR